MKKQISIELNKYLANVGVSYIKLHNLHWNVSGKDFKAVHEYLESLYNAFADVLDEVAELLKINGYYPAASLKEYLELAEVKELSSEERNSRDVIAIVLEDMKLLKSLAEKIRKEADQEDDYSVVSAMEDDLKQYSKNIWFLESMLK